MAATPCVSAEGAHSPKADMRAAVQVFSDHCFSPYLTGAKVAETLQSADHRIDFYDLDPFSSAQPTQAGVFPATPGTDRRCEVALDGDATLAAVASVAQALDREGITTKAELPAQFQPTPGTALLAARRLNPKKIAVVHVGTRPGPNGIETFMNVERMPLAATQN